MPNGNTNPYSGTNPIPRVSDFLRETADRANVNKGDEKKQQEAGKKVSGQHPSREGQQESFRKETGSQDGNRREVTDPTTGGSVIIEDVNKDFLENIENPSIVVPNSSLPGKGGDSNSGVCWFFLFFLQWGDLLMVFYGRFNHPLPSLRMNML
jgi:hypothetical protein